MIFSPPHKKTAFGRFFVFCLGGLGLRVGFGQGAKKNRPKAVFVNLAELAANQAARTERNFIENSRSAAMPLPSARLHQA